MNWFKTSQQARDLPPDKWGFNNGDPVKFFDKKRNKISVGTFEKAYMSPSFPAFPSRPMGKIQYGGNITVTRVAPLEEVSLHNTSDIKVNDLVDLMNYETESPAKVLEILPDNKFAVLGMSMRRFTVPSCGIIKAQ